MMKSWISFSAVFALENKMFPFLSNKKSILIVFSFSLFLSNLLFPAGCVSTPQPVIHTNLNPPPVYFPPWGYFIMVVDISIPKNKVIHSLQEQKLISHFLSDSLASYLKSPGIQKKINDWNQAKESKKARFWKVLLSSLEKHLYSKSMELNSSNQWVTIHRVLLGFQLKKGKRK
ncbi:MAG: hypothetical protein D6785_15840 [Planctomycetota bacterium]|nr:MAG: hypothetical protein D6785_15840 [Planctomycetota bacterium]